MSGLKSIIMGALLKVDAALSDLKLSVNHVTRGTPTYVPGAAPTYPEVLTPVSMLFTRYEATEIDGDRVLASDWRGIVLGVVSLPDFKVSDRIRVGSGFVDVEAGDYRIMYDDKVMAGDQIALHQLHLRKA